MTIRLDISHETVVITCTDCPTWYGFQFTRELAEDSGTRHEELCHPEDYSFRQKVAKRQWWLRKNQN